MKHVANDHLPPGLPTIEDMKVVLDKLKEMNLSGIIIIGRVCPGCGGVHGFAVASDFSQNADVPMIMHEMADMCARLQPTLEEKVADEPKETLQ